MLDNIYNNIDKETATPVNTITDKELDEIILKMGSFLSIIQNKKANQAKLFIATVQNILFQKCFLLLTDIDNLQLLIYNLISKYPTLSKSKIVFSALSKHKKSKRVNKKKYGYYKYRKKSI